MTITPVEFEDLFNKQLRDLAKRLRESQEELRRTKFYLERERAENKVLMDLIVSLEDKLLKLGNGENENGK